MHECPIFHTCGWCQDYIHWMIIVMNWIKMVTRIILKLQRTDLKENSKIILAETHFNANTLWIDYYTSTIPYVLCTIYVLYVLYQLKLNLHRWLYCSDIKLIRSTMSSSSNILSGDIFSDRCTILFMPSWPISCVYSLVAIDLTLNVSLFQITQNDRRFWPTFKRHWTNFAGMFIIIIFV